MSRQDSIQALTDGGAALVGFDFPIGLPDGYAKARFAGQDFRSILGSLGDNFFKPTKRAAFSESDLPILVDVFDWARLPEEFRREIERKHVVVWSGG